MTSFKSISIALGLASVFALGACGDAMSDANKFADELCACKDMECFQEVSKKAEKTMNKETMEKLTKEHPEEVAKVAARTSECAMKLMKIEPAE